jgi:ATP-dependent Lhr-like helicase
MDEAFTTFHPLLQPILQEKGFTIATEIQRLAIPQIQAGKDCLLIAPTGSGKTEAALLPLLDAIIRRREEGRLPSSGILVLYVTPLRALNRDIYRRIQEIGQIVDITIQVRHGDTTPAERRKQALNPPTILITTPETLQAILPGKKMRQHLKTVRSVIMDELHSLIDNKRGVQLSIGLERLRFLTGVAFQRLGLSATIGSPERVANFLAPNSSDVEIIIDPTSRNMEISVEYLPLHSYPAENHLSDDSGITRIQRIVELSQSARTVLLFTNTRQMAEILAWRLKQLKLEEVNSEVHHSSLGRDARLKTEQQLRVGDLDMVIATSSLELGIDIGDIDRVIQYMSPRRVTTFLQRVGRAGHKIHRTARGTILSPDPRDLLEAMVIARKSVLGELEETEVYTNALDVILHQLVGFVLDHRGRVPLKVVHDIFSRAMPFSDLTLEKIVEIANFASEAHLLWVAYDEETEDFYVSPRKGSFEYYFKRLSMIPDVMQYDVIDVTSRKKIGVLDEGFMATKGEKGVKFILKGAAWELLSVEDKKKVYVRPIRDPNALPSWIGELIPVSQPVAEGVGDLLIDYDPESLPIDENSKQTITNFSKDQMDSIGIPTYNRVIVESLQPVVVIHALLGSKASETLGILLSGLMEMRLGSTIGYRSDPYSTVLLLPYPKTSEVIECLRSLKPDTVKPLLENFVKRTDLFFWHLQTVAKRMGLISTDYEGGIPLRTILSRYTETIAGEEAINEIFFDKLNVPAIERFVERLNILNEIQLDRAHSRTGSPLSQASIYASQVYLFRTTPSQVVLNTVKRRLEQTIIRLTCMNIHCDWTSVKRIISLEDRLVCPSCESRYIATSHETVTNLKKLLRKEQKDPDLLEPEERKELRTAKRAADLVLSFGKRAAYVLAGRGVGPVSATRILRDPDTKNEMGLIRAIIQAETDFTRTREYWG